MQSQALESSEEENEQDKESIKGGFNDSTGLLEPIEESALEKRKHIDDNYEESSFVENEEDKEYLEFLLRKGRMKQCIETRKVNDTDFQKISVIGTGAYAKVFLVLDKKKQKYYAMKVLKKKRVLQLKQAEHTMTERRILGHNAQHPFIVGLAFAFQTRDTLNFVMEYCAGGELYFHLSRLGRFPEDRAKFYAAELALALGHLHENGVVYRDLKPENVLVDQTGHIKLADFGLSKRGISSYDQGAKTLCGTPEYLAPEVLQRKGHGTAVDWWSLGALLYEMLTGLPPWYSQNRQEMYKGICHGRLSFPNFIQLPARSLLTKLLERIPENRLGSKRGVEEIKASAFFHPLSWKDLLERRIQAPWKPDEGYCFVDKAYTRLPVNSTDEQEVSETTTTTIIDESAGLKIPKAIDFGKLPGNNSPSDLSRQFTEGCSLFDGFSYTAPSTLTRSPMMSRSPPFLTHDKKRNYLQYVKPTVDELEVKSSDHMESDNTVINVVDDFKGDHIPAPENESGIDNEMVDEPFSIEMEDTATVSNCNITPTSLYNSETRFIDNGLSMTTSVANT